MRRMEPIVRASDLRWTIVRPSALFAAETVSDYRVTTDHEAGILTSHTDIADALIRAAVEDRHVGGVMEVTTSVAQVLPRRLHPSNGPRHLTSGAERLPRGLAGSAQKTRAGPPARSEPSA